MKIIREVLPGTTTPAKVNRKTGIITLNTPYWDKLPESTQKNILLHEKGHFELQTSNEFAADEYAFKNFVGTEPQSLKKHVNAVAGMPMRTPEQKARAMAAYKRALWHDYQFYGNKKALRRLKELGMLNTSYQFSPFDYSHQYDPESLFLGKLVKKVKNTAKKVVSNVKDVKLNDVIGPAGAIKFVTKAIGGEDSKVHEIAEQVDKYSTIAAGVVAGGAAVSGAGEFGEIGQKLKETGISEATNTLAENIISTKNNIVSQGQQQYITEPETQEFIQGIDNKSLLIGAVILILIITLLK